MNGFDQFWIFATPVVHQVLGPESLTILRNSQIEPLIAGVDPTALELAADAALGASTLSLRLAGGALVAGYLVAGEQLLIDGSTYTVQEQVKAAPVATSFATVPITPALAAAVTSASPAVLLGASYRFDPVRIWRDQARDEKGELVAWERSMRVEICKLGALTTPRQLDVCVRDDGTRVTLTQLLSEDPSAWTFGLGFSPN